MSRAVLAAVCCALAPFGATVADGMKVLDGQGKPEVIPVQPKKEKDLVLGVYAVMGKNPTGTCYYGSMVVERHVLPNKYVVITQQFGENSEGYLAAGQASGLADVDPATGKITVAWRTTGGALVLGNYQRDGTRWSGTWCSNTSTESGTETFVRLCDLPKEH